MKILFAIFVAFLRAIGAFAVGFVVLAVAMLAGVLGGGGENGIFFSAFIFLFGTGWTLIPLVRISKLLGIVVSIAWIALAAFLTHKSSGGWLIAPWIFATTGVFILIVRTPPDYLEAHLKLTSKQDDNDRAG